jgi:putative flippase GtrA
LSATEFIQRSFISDCITTLPHFLDYALGVIFGYFVNRRWTFSSHGRSNHSFAKYLAIYLAVYLGNMSLLRLLLSGGYLGPLVNFYWPFFGTRHFPCKIRSTITAAQKP